MLVSIKAAWLAASVVSAIACSNCASTQSKPDLALWKPEPIAPWTPPKSSLPQDFVDNAKFLQSHGFGDPRGGEFRRAKVLAYQWSSRPGATRSVVGWVLPPRGHEKRKLVTLDGLTFSIEQVGEKLDLATEVRRLTAPPKQQRSFLYPPVALGRVATTLLINGDLDLTAEVYRESSKLIPGNDFSYITHTYLANSWDAAVSAFIAGDDQTAYEISKMLEQYGTELEARATKLRKNPGFPSTQRTFPFLDEARLLTKEVLRRQAETATRLDLTTLTKLSQPERIKVLIQNLENETPETWDSDKRAWVGRPTVSQRLTKEGFAAGEQLLDCIESDKRLTRQVRPSFYVGSRTMYDVRTMSLMTVADVASSVFAKITLPPDNLNRFVGHADPQQLRAYWNTIKNSTIAENYLAILKDDKANEYRHMNAALRLFETPPGEPRSHCLAESLSLTNRATLEKLLNQRALESLNVQNSEAYKISNQMQFASQYSQQLALLQKEKAIPLLRKVTSAIIAQSKSQTFDLTFFALQLSNLFDVRMLLGDREAFQEYASFLKSGTGSSTDYGDSELFLPLARRSSQPAAQALAHRILYDPKSKWSIQANVSKANHPWAANGFTYKPFLKLNAVRQALSNVLKDKSVVGKVTLTEQGAEFTNAKVQSMTPFENVGSDRDPYALKPGETGDVRACDLLASSLAELRGAPKFKFYWSAAHKDKALIQMQSFFEKNASSLDERSTESWSDRWGPGYPARFR